MFTGVRGRRRVALVAAHALSVAGITAPLRAQVGANVATLAPLDFGTIISGAPSSVAATSSQAMQFRITGVLGAAGGFSIAFPTTLTRVGGGGSLPLSVCSSCGIYRVGTNSPTGGTVFNPATGVSGLVIVVSSTIYVWIGGTVSPPLNQPAGSYTGTVVITLAPIL